LEVLKMNRYPYDSLEILAQAEWHFKKDTAFDRAMACIAFDNSIEFSITTYLQQEYSPDEKYIQYDNNYETYLSSHEQKLEFFAEYLQKNELQCDFTIDDFKKMHVHAGWFFVPNPHYPGYFDTPAKEWAEAYRKAAIQVFNAFYGEDTENLLIRMEQEYGKEMNYRMSNKMNLGISSDIVEVTKTLKDLEAYLKFALSVMEIVPYNSELSLLALWRLFFTHVESASEDMDYAVFRAVSIEKVLEYEGSVNLRMQTIHDIMDEVDKIVAFVKDYPKSSDIVHELRQRHSRWLRPEITAVHIVQKPCVVFLETKTYSDQTETITRENLSDIMSSFSAKSTAVENAKSFLDLDACSLFITTKLLVPEAEKEIAEIYNTKWYNIM
jgi:hypothetical protein